MGRCSGIDYSLYLVTDDPGRYTGDWLENVMSAVAGGVTCVQYRDTASDENIRFLRVRKLQEALASVTDRRVSLVINNDVELAAAVKADGVHVGQGDMPPEKVRDIVGPQCEIGLSITAPDQLQRPSVLYADCLGIGPVFDARKTKADASEAMGVEGLTGIIERLPRSGISTVAIGGINTDNAAEVLRSGVEGLAVVSAFSRAADPRLVAEKFRKLMK